LSYSNRRHGATAYQPYAISLSGLNLACNSRPMVYAYRLSFIWISVLHCRCMAKMPKYRNFNQSFTFGGSCATPFTDLGQIWPETEGPQCQISFESLYRMTLQGQKKLQFWANIDIWGTPVQILHAKVDPWYKLTCQISSRLVYSVSIEWQKTSKLYHFKTQHFCRPSGR